VEAAAQGPKWAEAIRLARSDLILFLDDDDEFEPAKIRVVTDEFVRRPDLAYLRHGFRVIDREGRLVTASKGASGRLQEVEPPSSLFVPATDKRPELLRSLLETRGMNGSSYAIRRSFFTPFLHHLPRIEVSADQFFLYMAILGSGSLLLTNDPLTRYRAHGVAGSQLTSEETGSVGRWSYQLRRSRDVKLLLDTIRSAPGWSTPELTRRFIESRVAVWNLWNAMLGYRIAWRDVLRSMFGWGVMLRSARARSVLPLLVLALFSMAVRPAGRLGLDLAARRALLRQRDRRVSPRPVGESDPL
jgi:hypothetical protein